MHELKEGLLMAFLTMRWQEGNELSTLLIRAIHHSNLSAEQPTSTLNRNLGQGEIDLQIVFRVGGSIIRLKTDAMVTSLWGLRITG